MSGSVESRELENAGRFALYFAPGDDTDLARFGRAALLRTAESMHLPVSATPDSESETHDWAELIASPAHYGFHATLKAPFTLKANYDEGQLLKTVAKVADQFRPVTLSGLAVGRVFNIAALVLDKTPDALDDLAAVCVTEFEPFRAKPSAWEITKRLEAGLSARQNYLLSCYGYPYVLDEFRFHMTLSNALSDSSSDFLAWLRHKFRRIVRYVPVLDRLAVFYQNNRSSPFVRIAEFPLGLASS